MGLRRALTLLVLATLVPFLAFSAFAVHQSRREQSRDAEQVLLDAARALVVALDEHFDATSTALRVLGSSEQLDAGDYAAFHRQCLRALDARDEWRTISLFDVTGHRILMTSERIGAPLPGTPPALMAGFEKLVATRTPDVSDLFQSPVTGQHVVSLGVPIVRDGAVRWVISAGMTPGSLGRLATARRGHGEWKAMLLDRRGQPVGVTGTAPLAVPAEGTTEGVAHARSADGTTVLAAYSRSARFGWSAAVSAPMPGGIFEGMVRAIPSLGLAVLIVGLAGAVWAARRLSRPIEALALAAQRIGRGEAVSPVPSGVKEVAALSAALVGAGEERTRAAADLAKVTERLRILHEIDRKLVALKSPAAIAEAVLPRVRDLLGVPRVIVNLFNVEEGVVEWLAAAGRRRVYVGPRVRYSLAMAGDLAALRRGEPQVIDVDALPPSDEAKALLQSGVHVYMVVPMFAGGELIGSVSFGGETGEFPPEQVSIAQDLATQLAIAITQARLTEHAQRRAGEVG
jgi:hypothetical protein